MQLDVSLVLFYLPKKTEDISVVVHKSDGGYFLPWIALYHDNNDTFYSLAGSLLKKITYIEAKTDRSGFLPLHFVTLFDNPNRYASNMRRITVVFTATLPEKVELYDGYEWISFDKLMKLQLIGDDLEIIQKCCFSTWEVKL